MSKVIKVRGVEIGRGRPKICCSVMGDTSERVLSEAVIANDTPCDIVEFRADHFAQILDIASVKSLLRKLRRVVTKPMIFTLRSANEGGKADVAKEYYKEVLLMAADENAADFIDIEQAMTEDDRDFIKKIKESGCYVILSKHDFDKTPTHEEIFAVYASMEEMGADIVKAAYMPNSRRDVLNLINATVEYTQDVDAPPVIAISMGKIGMITRIMGGFLESAVTFAAMTSASAPGQIGAAGMKNILDTLHNNYKKVILVGGIASGKTTIANALYTNYAMKKLDLDAYIEKKEQVSIADMVEKDLDLFHRKQTKYLRKALEKDYQVISVGTGAAFRKENVEMMKEHGIVVLLEASPDTIAKRMKADPARAEVLEVLDPDSRQRMLYEANEVYKDVADLVIATDDKNIDQISKEIVETLGFTL